MSRKKFIDLSQPLYNGIPLAGVLPRFHSWPCLELAAGDSVNCNAALISDHTGTHCDAPRHILADGKTIDQYAVDAFSGPGVCLDVRAWDEKAITIEAVREAEKGARGIVRGDAVLLCTDHSRHWGPIPAGYAYLQNRPWVDPPAARYLLDKGIKVLGIDVGGPDPLGGGHAVHELLLGNDVLIVESLANLTEIINRDFYFLCFPLKFTKATGAPARAVAMIEED